MSNFDIRAALTVDLSGNWKLYTNMLPPRTRALGTVTRDIGDTGALVVFETSGLYAQVNAGAVRALDQQKTAAAVEAAHRETLNQEKNQ